jgi:hypothetical protein
LPLVVVQTPGRLAGNSSWEVGDLVDRSFRCLRARAVVKASNTR